jgi:activating signal cointegrator complex subunit 3
MEVLFEIMPRAKEIADQVNESQLRIVHEQNVHTNDENTRFLAVHEDIDPELEHLNVLRQNAMEAMEFLSLVRDETQDSSAKNGPSSVTHTVKRTSDKATAKLLKKATKDAAKAMEAARKAGAILDDELEASGYNMSAIMSEAESQSRLGFHLMGEDDFKDFQASLLPAGTKEYHTMKSLPTGTIREQHEDYEIVTIPSTFRDPSKLCERIILADVMTSVERKAFSGTSSLNPMQSTVFQAAFHSNDNLLICAPTGAGKTNVAMLTVVAHLSAKGIIRNESDPYASYQHIGNDQVVSRIGRKIVYIAPMKALAQEVVEKFSSKLKSLQVVVRELTGDMQLSRAEAERSDILVTTPEKWDVVTRKGGDGSLAQTCGLLIIDEVHLLADDRGAVIESVVARLHRFVESSQTRVRIVGLSATLPNYKDVATFLRVDHQRGLFHFGPEHRPVPLQQQFIGILETKNRFKLEKKMNQVCYDIVSDSLRRGYQVMIFVHSRKGTSETIEELIELAQKKNELEKYFITKGSEENGDAHSRFAGKAEKSRNRELTKYFHNGMGIHHAGMLRGDRKLTEQMFNEGAIKVLCCTATLAWGESQPKTNTSFSTSKCYS